MENMTYVIRKIKKSLALAKGNSNENEAHTAMLLAQQLMAKYNLSIQDIPTEEASVKEVSEGRIRLSRIEWWHLRLARIIDNNFRTYSFYSRGRSVGFLGLKEDVEIASEVYKFALESVKNHSTKYLTETRDQYYSRSRSEAIAIKNDYIKGFIDGLNRKFEEQVASESYALVLVKDEIVETAYQQAGWKAGKQRSFTTAGDQDAYERGFIEGKSMNEPLTKRLEVGRTR